MNDINKINGNEVIAFLNSVSDKLTHRFNIVKNSFVFSKQILRDTSYRLEFSVIHNDWGSGQTLNRNVITITKDNVSILMHEIFDGDGTEEAIEALLVEFLRTHTFNPKPANVFYELKEAAFQKLGYVKYTDHNDLDDVIAKLIEARSYMKC